MEEFNENQELNLEVDNSPAEAVDAVINETEQAPIEEAQTEEEAPKIDLVKEFDELMAQNSSLAQKTQELEARAMELERIVEDYTNKLTEAEFKAAKAENDKEELSSIIKHLEVSVKERKQTADLVNKLLGGR